jgi:K+-sensing histidine kinase KdpD
VVIVPLAVGPRCIGALTFGIALDRRYGPRDRALAESLGHRCALALEHARLYEQARAAIELREQTLAVVSHDLRVPLATISMAADILTEVQGTAAAVGVRRMAIDKIQRSAVRMERMVADLLDFASIDTGRTRASGWPSATAIACCR